MVALVAVAGAVAALAPFAGLDERSRAWALAVTASSRPSDRVIVVEMTPAELRRGACDRELPEALQRGGAKGALLPPPLDALCDPSGKEALAPLPESAIHVGAEGEIFGFDVSSPDMAPAKALGLPTSSWISARATDSVPVIELSAITNGRVAASVLSNRVVVASLALSPLGVPLERRVAATVAGALDGELRSETPRWLGSLLPVLATVGAFYVRERYGGRVAMLVPLSAAFLAIGLHLGLATAGFGLSPLGSVLAALAVSLIGLLVAALQSWRSIAIRTGDILQQPAAVVTRRPLTPEGSALWSAVKQLAADSFPAEAVLVADHDVTTSTLRFHDLPGPGDMIAEAARDSRRPPYRDDAGLPVTRVVHGFLRERDVPCVLVPLIAHGELQGYLVLVGDAAAQLHLEDPARAQVLGDELGLLVHQARLGSDRSSPSPSPRKPPRLAQIAGNAQTIAEHAYYFSEMAHALPIAVAWADEAGRVRIVNRRLAEVLAMKGIALPEVSAEGVLATDALMLGDLLAQLIPDDRDVDIVRAMRGNGLTTSVTVSDPPIRCRLHARAKRHRGSGQKPIAGYLVTLVPEGDATFPGWDSSAPSGPPSRLPLDTLPSPL
ncbi:MAG: hypothetical protein U0441_13820 [Polyangiaceae bacterium]